VLALTDIQFDNSLVFFLFITSRSEVIKRLVWYDLALETRKKYQSIIEFYETFCLLSYLTTWSTFAKSLKEWVTCRMYESLLLKQRKIKSNTIVSYLINLRSRHVDREMSTQIFENLRLRLIIKEEKRIFS
jgi:hypothetical protein